MSDRQQVSNITITINGKSVTPPIGPVSAIFMDDMSIEKILIPFYEEENKVGNYHQMTRDETKLEFGENIANAVFGAAPGPKTIDKAFIDTVWNTTDDEGELTPYIPKRPSCAI